MATVSRIYGEDFKGYLSSLREAANQLDSPMMSQQLRELCAELEPIVEKLSHDYPWPGKTGDAERWAQKLDDLQGSLAACTFAKGVGSMCRPFYDDVEKLIRDCKQEART